MFTSPFTTSMYNEFVSTYQSLSKKNAAKSPYVYADSQGVRLIADLIDDTNSLHDSVFALSVAEDGWMELLALYE